MTAITSTAAQALWQAWTSAEPIDGLPADCRPADLSAGYAVQAELDALAGTRVGWKIAATAPAGRRALGVDRPIAGPLYERALQPPGATLTLADFRMGTIEAEIGFVIARDLPAADAPYDRDTILAALGPFVPAFELPASRYVDHRIVGAAQLAADAACAGTVVFGAPVDSYDPDALSALTVTIRTAGTTASGSGADVLGDPVEAVRWIADELAAHGRGLRRGEIVITGAAALVAGVEAGPVTASYGELATLAITLA